MKIDNCIACGQCMDFITSRGCPTGAFFFRKEKGYGGAAINIDKCSACGKCLKEVDCLGECIRED